MKPALLLVVPAVLALAGCGGGSSAPKQAEAPRAVYTNSGDCGESGKLEFDICAKLMERAVAEHEKTAPTYKSLKSCEATEGDGRCERSDGTNYRPRLMAFLVTFSKPATVKPLYGAPDGEIGFKTADKTAFLVKDDTLTFSEHSQSLAESSVTKKKKAGPKVGG